MTTTTPSIFTFRTNGEGCPHLNSPTDAAQQATAVFLQPARDTFITFSDRAGRTEPEVGEEVLRDVAAAAGAAVTAAAVASAAAAAAAAADAEAAVAAV